MLFSQICKWGGFIKFSHTVFALLRFRMEREFQIGFQIRSAEPLRPSASGLSY